MDSDINKRIILGKEKYSNKCILTQEIEMKFISVIKMK